MDKLPTTAAVLAFFSACGPHQTLAAREVAAALASSYGENQITAALHHLAAKGYITRQKVGPDESRGHFKSHWVYARNELTPGLAEKAKQGELPLRTHRSPRGSKTRNPALAFYWKTAEAALAERNAEALHEVAALIIREERRS